MFDGIKIDCRGCNPLQWVDIDYLSFHGSYDLRTGEILKEPAISKYKGLTVKIIPSTVHPGLNHGSVQGSLHKYYNEGVHNANDFHFQDVINTVNDLYQRFGFSPLSPFRNIEFGVNIPLPIPAKQFIKFIVSMPKRRFADLSIEQKKVGKVYTTDQYHFKIYDKSMISDKAKNNLLRIEIQVKEMKYLKPYGIEKVTDITDYGKVSKLGNVLARIFSEVIINDPGLNTQSLSKTKRNSLKDYMNPLFWEGLTWRKRQKHRNKLAEISVNTGSSGIQNTITKQIVSKWNELLNDKQKKGVFCGNFLDDSPQIKRGCFAELEYSPQNTPPDQLKPDSLRVKKKDIIFAEKRYCKICGSDITGQKSNSFYCSELKHGRKCRNKAGYILRRKRMQLQREQERNLLKKLHRIRERATVEICKLTDTTGNITIVRPDQITMNPAEIRKTTKVQLTGKSPPGSLTTKRAKEFLKYLTGLNLTIKKKQSNESK